MPRTIRDDNVLPDLFPSLFSSTMVLPCVLSSLSQYPRWIHGTLIKVRLTLRGWWRDRLSKRRKRPVKHFSDPATTLPLVELGEQGTRARHAVVTTPLARIPIFLSPDVRSSPPHIPAKQRCTDMEMDPAQVAFATLLDCASPLSCPCYLFKSL